MRTAKRTCPHCNQLMMVQEDPDAILEVMAYGSNDAGLKFPDHKAPNGTQCAGSGLVLQ